MIVIRKCQPDDVENVKEFLRDVIPDLEVDIVKKSIIAFQNEQIVGTISYDGIFVPLIRYFIYLNDLEGIQNKLFEQLKQELKTKGVNKVYILESYNKSNKIFNQLGFKDDGDSIELKDNKCKLLSCKL